jgi:hypothetical protein
VQALTLSFQQLTQNRFLQIRQNKGVIAKFFQIKELASGLPAFERKVVRLFRSFFYLYSYFIGFEQTTTPRDCGRLERVFAISGLDRVNDYGSRDKIAKTFAQDEIYINQ